MSVARAGGCSHAEVGYICLECAANRLMRAPPPIEWSGFTLPRPTFRVEEPMPENDDAKVTIREELVEVTVRAYCPCGGELQHSPSAGHPHGHKCRNLVDCGKWYTLSKSYPYTRRAA